MCFQCMSNTEALLFSGVFAGAAARQGARHVAYSLGLVNAEARTEREARIYRENVAFIESLGLDAKVVLGSAPEPAHAPARSSERRSLRSVLRDATTRLAPAGT